jgi:Fe-Mn family superoxide dismutase
MNSTLLRTTAVRSALRAAAPSSGVRAGFAATTFVRGKATLPDLPCTHLA